MRIYQAHDYHDLSRKAANIISAQIIMKPEAVLGLATGSSPIGTYQQLIEWYKKGDLDFCEATSVNLDEYKGLGPEDEQSYSHFMHVNFFDHINIDPKRTFIPNGLESDEKKECERYNKVIASCGGIDLQLLGIGTNGHIGFNEPADAFTDGTFRIKLTQSTIDANSRYFTETKMPEYALTMGVASIMNARQILLIATGKAKAKAVCDTVKGPITPRCPASVLRLHPNAVLLLDEAAASLL